MHLVRRENSNHIFQLGRSEKLVLLQILKLYPMLNRPYSSAPETERKDGPLDPQLLEEALAEHRKECKRRLEEMLSEENRFVPNEAGFLLTLSQSEVEWLLQVLNDIRVGAWIALGSPDPKKGKALKVKPSNVHLAAAMDLAMAFQAALLGEH